MYLLLESWIGLVLEKRYGVLKTPCVKKYATIETNIFTRALELSAFIKRLESGAQGSKCSFCESVVLRVINSADPYEVIGRERFACLKISKEKEDIEAEIIVTQPPRGAQVRGEGNARRVAARSASTCESQLLIHHKWTFIKGAILKFVSQLHCDAQWMVVTTLQAGF